MHSQTLRVSLAVQLNRVAADAFVAGQRTPANVTINGLERRKIVGAQSRQERSRADDLQGNNSMRRHVGRETVGKGAKTGSGPHIPHRGAAGEQANVSPVDSHRRRVGVRIEQTYGFGCEISAERFYPDLISASRSEEHTSELQSPCNL